MILIAKVVISYQIGNSYGCVVYRRWFSAFFELLEWLYRDVELFAQADGN